MLGVTKTNSNVMVIVNFLYKIVQVFEDYFGELDQESIRDNFVLIYELLDEMCDFGFPQHTQSNVLKEYICIDNGNNNKGNLFNKQNKQNKQTSEDVAQLPPALTGVVCRKVVSRNKYKKNEVFVDVIEKVDCLVSHNGTILDSQIFGSIKMKAYLSGMPEIKMGLNDKILMQRRRRRSLVSCFLFFFFSCYFFSCFAFAFAFAFAFVFLFISLCKRKIFISYPCLSHSNTRQK